MSDDDNQRLMFSDRGRLMQRFLVRMRQHDTMKTFWWISLGFALLSQLYLLPKVLSTDDGQDFRLIWLAGEMWLFWENPYSILFDDRYLVLFGAQRPSHFWVYPPYWFPVAAGLSTVSFASALLIWNLLGWAAILISPFCLAASLRFESSLKRASAICLLIAVGSFIQATPFALALGQTSLLLYLGVAMVVLGNTKQSTAFSAAGLVLVALKPQVGLILLAYAHSQRSMLRAALVADAVLLLAALPVLYVFGLPETFSTFLANLDRYGSTGAAANIPQELIGLPKLLSVLGWIVEPVLMILLAVGVVLAARAFGMADFPRLGLSIAAALLVGGLHTYDLTIAICLIPFLAPFSRGFGLKLLSALPLLRPANLAAVLPLGTVDAQIFPGSLHASIGLFLLAFLVPTAAGKKPQRKDTPPGDGG